MNENKQCKWSAEPSHTDHDSFVVFKIECSGRHCTISKDEIRLMTSCPYCNKRITHLDQK
jgi:hypothetical protein